MEIVSVEKKTFEDMIVQTNAFVEKVAALQRKGDGRRLGKWLTGDEVCRKNDSFCERKVAKPAFIEAINRKFVDGAGLFIT